MKNKSIPPIGEGERIDINFEKNKRLKYEHLQRYNWAAKKCEGRILDLGCGTGYGTKILYDRNNEVFGLDIDRETIEWARKNYPGPKYVTGDVERLPFKDNFFDGVVAFEIVEHVSSPEKMLEEIYRVLKKEGELLISTPNLRHFGKILKHYLLGRPYPEKLNPNFPFHQKEFYYRELVDLLKNKGFKIIRAFGQTFPIFPTIIFNRLIKLPILYKILVFSGRPFPKWAFRMVIQVKK